MLFFILFVLPYIVGFVALAFWRQGWTLMAATVAMIVVYFFSIVSGDGPGAFAADALPAVLAAGIAAGLVTSVIAMTSNYRPGRSGNVPTRIYRWLYGNQVLLKPSGISRPSGNYVGAESDSLAQPTWHLRSVAICNIAE